MKRYMLSMVGGVLALGFAVPAQAAPANPASRSTI